MIVSGIVAMGSKREIGRNNQMLWHIKEDFKHFKKTTMGHHLIMGRKTFESIGRPLPGRKTIILSQSNYQYEDPNVLLAGDPASALNLAKSADDDEVFIAGGAQIYELFKANYNKLYLSFVDFSGEADAYFPMIDLAEWELQSRVDYPAQEGTPAWHLEVWVRP